MSEPIRDPRTMSTYERKRWAELQSHWQKKAARRQLLPPKAQVAMRSAAQATKDAASKAGRAIAEVTPDKVKDATSLAVDSALAPAVMAAVHVLELLNEWVVELSNPEVVIRHHRERGHNVASLDDLKNLELKSIEALTQGMALRWRTAGAGEGAGLGALAMIPVPGVASAAAIALDMVAMQVLSTAIATRICYAYGFDANDPAVLQMIDRMVVRSYRKQVPKAGLVTSASAAFEASRGRINWSQKLRDDHRLLAAVEKLMKQLSGGKAVPVKNARMGLPLVAVFAGAGTNAHVLGDVVKQARHYAATLFLVEKYGLELPPNLRHDVDSDSGPDGVDEA
jgi:EcsC protein family